MHYLARAYTFCAWEMLHFLPSVAYDIAFASADPYRMVIVIFLPQNSNLVSPGTLREPSQTFQLTTRL